METNRQLAFKKTPNSSFQQSDSNATGRPASLPIGSRQASQTGTSWVCTLWDMAALPSYGYSFTMERSRLLFCSPPEGIQQIGNICIRWLAGPGQTATNLKVTGSAGISFHPSPSVTPFLFLFQLSLPESCTRIKLEQGLWFAATTYS